ncbi:hypothetical protein DMI62_10035 [Escherichia coli]|nr:hypothetical protein [Escherichia coli]
MLLRPVSAESLDNTVATSTAPFITHETARAQSLNGPAPATPGVSAERQRFC